MPNSRASFASARTYPGSGRPNTIGIPIDEDLPSYSAYDPERSFTLPPDESPETVFRPHLTEGGSGPAFSVQRFADQLRTRLRGAAKGWAFVISMNGQEANADAGGNAIDAADIGGERDMTPDTRLNIASVTKTITAVAVLRLLRENNLGTTAKIWPFLPEEWSLGPNVEDLSFHHLLTHTSGLSSTNNNFQQTLTYAGLRNTIQTGANPGASYNYLNANFALFRVIVPALWRRAGQLAANNDNATAAAFFYAVYVIEEIFSRMGGSIGANASTSPLDSNPTRYYVNPNSNLGVSLGNWALWAGGGGWHLSARELAALMAHITYNDDILTPEQRAAMDFFRYGWRPASFNTGQFGVYAGHGGSINWNQAGNSGSVRAAVMKFNLQVEASVVANSRLSTSGDNATNLLTQAYDAAWT